MINKWGYNCYETDMDIKKLLNLVNQSKISIYYINLNNDKITFYSSVFNHKIFKNNIHFHLLYTNGLLGMIIRSLNNKTRLVSYIFFICIFVFLNSIVFDVRIYGDCDELDVSMNKSIQNIYYKYKNINELKSKLIKKYNDNLSWMEVYEKGNNLIIRYKSKEKIENENKNNKPLIAKKNGLIASFDLIEGYKEKNINDIVKKGEIIVNNQMLDSYNKLININVSGKVYAYTWNKIMVEMNENILPDAINFYSLLLEARNKIILKDLKNEKIVKENILHFYKKEGRIKLEILYTLLEDITS